MGSNIIENCTGSLKRQKNLPFIRGSQRRLHGEDRRELSPSSISDKRIAFECLSELGMFEDL